MTRAVLELLSPGRLSIAAVLLFAAAPALAAQQPADSVYDLAAVKTLPRPLNLDELRVALQAGYPPHLRAAGQAGEVSVTFVLGSDGVPRGVAVKRSTDAAFDSATVASVSLLRFSPARVGDKPVPVRVELPVHWTVAAPKPAPAAAASAAADSVAAPDPRRTYELRDVDPKPRPIDLSTLSRAMRRMYPPTLHTDFVENTVQVRFAVTAEGGVDSASVTHSTDPRFDRLTLEAIRRLRFTPGRINGRPVRTWVELPLVWRPGPTN